MTEEPFVDVKAIKEFYKENKDRMGEIIINYGSPSNYKKVEEWNDLPIEEQAAKFWQAEYMMSDEYRIDGVLISRNRWKKELLERMCIPSEENWRY